MPEERPRPKTTDRLIRLLWYGIATILILTLPIFSDRGGEPVPEAGAVQSAAGERLLSRSEAGRSSAVGGQAVGRAVRSLPSARHDSNPGRRPSRGRPTPTLAERDESRVTSLKRRSPIAGGVPESPAQSETSGTFAAQSGGTPTREAPARPFSTGFQGGGAVDPGNQAIQRGYNQAYATLFPEIAGGVIRGTTGGNPFQDAGGQDGSGDGSSGDDSGGDGSTGDGGDAGEGGESGGDGADGGESGDSGDSSPNPDGSDGAPEEPPPGENDSSPPEPGDEPTPPEPTPPAASTYNFLLVGDFPDNPTLVSRANLVDNTFVFENSYELDFFPGTLPSLQSFVNGERLMTTDLNQDGLTDVVASRVIEAVGSLLESYLQVSPGRFELHGSVGLYLQEVTSFSLFDITGDGVDELAVLVRGSDHLFLYQLRNGLWTYLRELVLPFRPGVLLTSSAGAPLGARLLYVTDDSLSYVVNLSLRRPDVLRFGSRAPLNHLSLTEVDWSGEGASPVLVFQLTDVLLLAERTGGDMNMIGGFDIRGSVPAVILGDYLGRGARQLFWVP